jgi:hypothetical protein
MPTPATPSMTPHPRPVKSLLPATTNGPGLLSTTPGSSVLAAVESRFLASNDDDGFVPDIGDSSMAAASGAAKPASDLMLPADPDPDPDPDPVATSDSAGGYVTAETALLLPVLIGIGYALALVVLLAADQIRCGDAAWEAARALARGVPTAQLSDIAARYAPAGAHASVWSKDGSLTVEVDRDQSVASRFLPSIRISATATVPCEPQVDGCQTDSNDISGRPNG